MQLTDKISTEKPKSMLKHLGIVVIFGIALAYFEAAVVVYLRAIFYPGGFIFPLQEFGMTDLWQRLLVTEIGREAASIVLILSAAWLFAGNLRRSLAHFLIIFAIWDIFYYIWLKLLLGWPASIMDWDILFLIPLIWASPVLAPLLVSALLLIFAGIILYRDYRDKPLKAGLADWAGFIISALIVVISFCSAGLHIRQSDYRLYFSWLLFAAGCAAAALIFIRCLKKSK
ncbi:hypothetical protein ACFL1G_05550 [Planctomycetota bacterium]